MEFDRPSKVSSRLQFSKSMTSATFTDVDRFVAALGFEHQDQQQIADRHGCWHVSRKL